MASNIQEVSVIPITERILSFSGDLHWILGITLIIILVLIGISIWKLSKKIPNWIRGALTALVVPIGMILYEVYSGGWGILFGPVSAFYLLLPSLILGAFIGSVIKKIDTAYYFKSIMASTIGLVLFTGGWFIRNFIKSQQILSQIDPVTNQVISTETLGGAIFSFNNMPVLMYYLIIVFGIIFIVSLIGLLVSKLKSPRL